MSEWTSQDYIQTVDSIAADALAEYPEDEDDRSQYVHESVDGSEWVIYYAAHEPALQATQNEPDAAEVRGMSGGDADWRDQRQLAVYLAMEADVFQEIERLIGERDDENDE